MLPIGSNVFTGFLSVLIGETCLLMRCWDLSTRIMEKKEHTSNHESDKTIYSVVWWGYPTAEKLISSWKALGCLRDLPFFYISKQKSTGGWRRGSQKRVPMPGHIARCDTRL